MIVVIIELKIYRRVVGYELACKLILKQILYELECIEAFELVVADEALLQPVSGKLVMC